MPFQYVNFVFTPYRAYHRKQYNILSFCHTKKYTNLAAPELILTSAEFSLKQQRRPLLMDAVMTKEFAVVKIVLSSCFSQHDIVSRVYDYPYGNSRGRESILSYACNAYLNARSNDSPDVDILPSLLSKEVVGVHLTTITLTGAGLRRLPLMLMHPNLRNLDVRENILDSFPSADVGQNRLGWDCPSLQVLNFSNNNFVEIPADIFKLPSLIRLIACDNKIKALPIEMWKAPALKILDLRDNQIQVLPCHNPQLRHEFGPYHPVHSMSFSQVQQSYQAGRVFFNQAVPLESAKHGYINYDIDSSHHLHKGQVGFSLQTLELSGNQLTEIPRSLPCLAPLLQTLKVAKNRITKLGQASDYPPLLQTLDAKNNGIITGIEPAFESPNIACVQSQVTQGSPVCSHISHHRLSNLKFLYLSSNRLAELQIEYEVPEIEFSTSQRVSPNAFLDHASLSPASLSPASLPPASLGAASPELLFPRLQGLRISNNRLTKLPENIHRLEKLCELAFDGNPGIEKLPDGLHRLSNLFTLKYEGINDPVVQEIANFKNAPEILYYLKARECQYVDNINVFACGYTWHISHFVIADRSVCQILLVDENFHLLFYIWLILFIF